MKKLGAFPLVFILRKKKKLIVDRWEEPLREGRNGVGGMGWIYPDLLNDICCVSFYSFASLLVCRVAGALM